MNCYDRNNINFHSPMGSPPLLMTIKLSVAKPIGLRYVGAPPESDGAELARKPSPPSATLSGSMITVNDTLCADGGKVTTEDEPLKPLIR